MTATDSLSTMHRSDPLDIPLIDNHLLLHLLLPRLVSSIKFTFPQIYSDWSSTSLGEGDTDATHNNNGSSTKKRILEGLLKTCLLLGSCRHVYNNKRQGSIRKVVNEEVATVHVTTPAMNSLGMFLRPTTALRSNRTTKTRSYDSQTLTSRMIQQYGKVVALLLTTVIIPTCYQELKHRRAKQLEHRERQLRLDEIRTEFRSSMNATYADGSNFIQSNDIEQQQTAAQTPLSKQQRQGIIIQQRASKRKSQLITFITDTILGMSDVCIPPLRLVTYIAYLWGMGMGTRSNSYIHAPFLSMQIAGWEYVSSSSDGLNDNDDDGSNTIVNNSGQQQQQQQRYQRHVNYQYGNRRLLVEEALRTASMVIPPRRRNNAEFTTAGDGGGSGGNVGTNLPVRGQPNVPPRVRSRIHGRGMERENALVAHNSNNLTGEIMMERQGGMLSR